jgi:hypothetical protein
VVLPDFLAKIRFNKSKKNRTIIVLKPLFSDAMGCKIAFIYNLIIQFLGNEATENNLFHSKNLL